MTNPKENGLTSPQSQPVQNTLTSTSDFTGVPEWLYSPTDAHLRLACGDGRRMGQVTGWNTNWRDFSESLSVPEVGEKRGAFWCASDYGESTERKRASVKAVSLIVLDVEMKTEQPPPLADALALCESRGWQAFGHTTFTHTPDAPRYRLCMVPSRSIKPEELRCLVDAVAQELGLECACDLAASGDPARLYYTPRVASEIDKATFEHGSVEGAAVHVDVMLAMSKPKALIPALTLAAATRIREAEQLGDDLWSALDYLDPDNYDLWIGGLMALKTAPISNAQEIAHLWSRKSAKYSYEHCQAKWESLKPTQTSYKAIFSKAQELGWVNPFGGWNGIGSLLNGRVVDSETGELIQPLLKSVSVADVLTNPAPQPEFIWDGYIPCGVVTILGAHGGTGKSTIALMLAVCASVGRPLFRTEVKHCKVLFVSLEDSGAIARHRLANICKLWNIDPLALADRLHIVDGTEYPELFSAENRGVGILTDTYMEMSAIVQTEGIGLVIVDNASDAYGGDEIQRRQVRAFIRALGRAIKPTNAGCLLLAHVDKNTSKARKAEGGEGYSGSTAWHNSARSRLFLTRGDDGLLTLEHQKSNLGRMREPITLDWLGDGLPQLLEQGGGFDIDSLTRRQQGRDEDAKAIALLKLIAEFEGREQYCSPVATARNNVFAMLKSEPAFQRLKLNSDGCKRIVTQSQRAKWLEPVEYRTHDRKTRPRWTLTIDGRAIAGLSAPSAPCAPCNEESAKSAGGAPCAPCA